MTRARSSVPRRPVGIAVMSGATLAATAGAAALALRRWGRAIDPGGEGLEGLPGVSDHCVTSADGARIAVTVATPDVSRSEAHTPPVGDEARTPPAGDVVLAHGWTNDRRVWAPVARRLAAAGHRVVLYDQRGHGSSTLGSDGFALEALAADLCTVLEQLDMADAVVAGHSMGGMAAQVMVTVHPEVARRRVGALVLVATACERIGTGRPATDRLARRVIAHRRVERALAARGVSPFLVRRTFGRHVCRAQLDAVCEMFVATPAEVRADALTAMAALDLSGALASVELPVTVVAGSRDRLLPPSQARRIAQLVPGARLVTFEGTGHMVPLEEPDRLAGLVAGHATDAARRARGGPSARDIPGDIRQDTPVDPTRDRGTRALNTRSA